MLTPRAYAELALIVALGLTGWGYVHQRDGRLRAEGRLEVAQAVADSTAQAAAADKAATVKQDSARAAADRREAAARQAAERRAAIIAAEIPTRADSVVTAAAPADSGAVRARLVELQSTYEARDRERLAVITSQDTVIAQLRALDVTRLAAIGSLEAALAASQEAGRTALESRPGFLQKNVPKLAVVGAAVLGWVLRGLVDR